ncbi:Helitron helicase [Phytophthora megakarya]|uniref:Helitron helicase n=1 Tax=Phytophthora megakarya TaxID=4795 RepID=A0A225UAM4_9STRA|nr:Helitron helicase [Phytophthora megakarya]
MNGVDAYNNPHGKLAKKKKPVERKLNASTSILANRNNFDPSIVPGGRHYFLRYVDDDREIERVCGHSAAWKFPNETPGCCCRTGLVTVPSPQRPPEQLLPL